MFIILNLVCQTLLPHTSRPFSSMIGRARNAIVPADELDHRLSYSWSEAYPGELIDASIGRPTPGYVHRCRSIWSTSICSAASVISKMALLNEFKQLSLKMCHPCNIHMTYNELKKLNRDYEERKQAMISFLEQANFGYWSADKIHLEQFKYSSSSPSIIRNNWLLEPFVCHIDRIFFSHFRYLFRFCNM